MVGWFQTGIASLIAGSVVPGLANPARMIVLAAIAIGAAAGLDALRRQVLSRPAVSAFFAFFSIVIGLWLCAMMYGSYICTLCLAYYRVLGVAMIILSMTVAGFYWLALASRNTRIAVAALILAAVGLKLAYWGYYVPEWNYREQPGSLGARNRSMDSAQVDTVHAARLAAGPGVFHEAKRSSVVQPLLPRISAGEFVQVSPVAPVGI